jgi:hypothetical protein
MMQPPGRIEQLNNFQDSMQSPDGLDRLRAMQYIQASSQGLSGMPQVTVPQMQPQVPMMNRQDGGPVINKFGGGTFAKIIKSDEVKNLLAPAPQVVEEVQQQPIEPEGLVHSNTAQGILDRSIQGGTIDRNNFTSPVVSQPQGASDQALGQAIQPSPEGSQTQFTFEGNQPQERSLTLGSPMQGEFKSKDLAMAHAMANEGQALVNVYQLSDGSWDYQRTGKSPNTFYGGGMAIMKDGGQIGAAQSAQGLASLGRYGDNILVHMNPEELDGLASLGEITYNPVTGLPEAWGLRNIVRAVRRLAPVALAIAAPYAFGATTALGIGAATAGGSFFGNLIAGAKPKDALKAGLMSGLFAGGGAYLGGASSGFGSAGSSAGGSGTSAVTSGGMQGGLNIGNKAFVGTPGTTTLQQSLGNVGNTAASSARNISQFGNNLSGASNASLAGGQSNLIQNATNPLSYSSANVPSQYSGSMGNANQIGLANANVASPVNVVPVNQFAGGDGLMAQNQIISGTDVAQNLGGTQNIIPSNSGSTSIFAEGGLSKENLGKMGGEIYDKYSTTGGIAKLVGMDLSTPDWEAQYAAEAAAKNKELEAAGYTVDTGFDGQVVIRDSSGVTMPRNLTVQDILNRALGKSARTNLVARTDYAPTANAAQGGLIGLKHGGEFSGMVSGDGHGMEDNVYMPIVEKEQGSQVGTLAVSPSEYVVDSYTMAALGNGNADAGAKVMDNVVKRVRKKAYGDTKQPNEISGLSALEPMIERV